MIRLPSEGTIERSIVMNAILKCGWILSLVTGLTATSFAGPAPYESAVSKGMHAGRAHSPSVTRAPREYVQPRSVVQPSYAQQRTYRSPRVVTVPGMTERRVFSYEPASPTFAAPTNQRRTYSYEPVAPVSMAPHAGRGFTHTYENATMKGLGQLR